MKTDIFLYSSKESSKIENIRSHTSFAQTPARPSNAPLSAELERHRRFINWRTRAYRARWGYREDGGADPLGAAPA